MDVHLTIPWRKVLPVLGCYLQVPLKCEGMNIMYYLHDNKSIINEKFMKIYT